MCTCTSCKYTDSFSGWKYEDGERLPDHEAGGFDRWPCDEPKGPRKSAAEYAGHVTHGKAGLASGWAFKPGAAPQYPAWVTCQIVPPLPYPSKLVRDFIAAGYERSKPRRPTVAPKLQLVPKAAPAVIGDLADFVKRQLAA